MCDPHGQLCSLVAALPKYTSSVSAQAQRKIDEAKRRHWSLTPAFSMSSLKNIFDSKKPA
jgi:hypothetical protein